MLNKQPLTAFIPVRGGSKGIPGKNLRRLGKDTLLERTIKQALLCDYIDRVVVSTDDPEMYRIASVYGVASPSLRPAELASDAAGTLDVIRYTLEQMGIEDGYLLLLQTTSPLRQLDDINKVCKALEENEDKTEAVVSVSKNPGSHPDKMQKIKNGYLVSYLGKSSHVARQTLPEVYVLNGACYLTSIDIIRDRNTMVPDKTLPYEMPEERSINLDNMLDWYLLEKLVEEKIVVLEEYEI
jgi:CMP-N-acetylneuraminic acid synthetase